MLAFGNKILTVNSKGLEVWHPEPLPSHTIRLRYRQGTTPTFSYGTPTLVDAEQNIWDLTNNDDYWNSVLSGHTDLLEVINSNLTGVRNMMATFHGCTSLERINVLDTSTVNSFYIAFDGCTSLTHVPVINAASAYTMQEAFSGCTSLKSVTIVNTDNLSIMLSLFSYSTSLETVSIGNTSNVTNMGSVFKGCSSLKSLPLLDTSSVTNMNQFAYDCFKVESGALALYQQASSQAVPPTEHNYAFKDCGRDTVTGAAELAQIPSDWK